MKIFTCVCIPNKEASRKIERITKKISKECNSKRALSFIPHFTIRCEFKIKDSDIGKLKLDFEKLCSNFPKLKLKLTKYGFYPWKIIFLNIEKNPQLQLLHNECMRIIEKYRFPWIREIYKKPNQFSGKQLEYSLKYGYHFCFEFFAPHFTLAGHDMSEDSFQKTKTILKDEKEDIDFTIKYLAFFDRENKNKIFMKIPLRSAIKRNK